MRERLVKRCCVAASALNQPVAPIFLHGIVDLHLYENHAPAIRHQCHDRLKIGAFLVRNGHKIMRVRAHSSAARMPER